MMSLAQLDADGDLDAFIKNKIQSITPKDHTGIPPEKMKYT